MKYFAILKDSLREALDSKVLYVMIGICTIVILLVASLSFKRLPAEKTMEQFFFVEKDGREWPPVLAMLLTSKRKEKANPLDAAMHLVARYPYRLVRVDLSSGEADAPESEYALIVSKIIPKKDVLEMLGGLGDFGPKDSAKQERAIREIFEEAETLGYIRVENIEPIELEDAAKETARFRVTVKGTPKTLRIWVTEPSWIFGAFTFESMAAPLGLQLSTLAFLVIGIGSWVTVLVGIVITSFFIPNMLKKGTIDLVLVKPIRRWVLLLYKYVGGLTFVFFCMSFALVGIWLVLGLRSGLWPSGSLLLIFSLTFFFAILYSISTFVGVLTRSTVTSIMLTIVAYAMLGSAGFAHLWLEDNVKKEEVRESNKGKFRLVQKEEGFVMAKDDEGPPREATRWADSYSVRASRVFQAMSPRTEDLNHLNGLIIYTDFMTGDITNLSKFDTSERNWWLSLLVSGLWIAIFLGLACAWFTWKDY